MKKNKDSKNILVTGGYGFIGSNFVRHLYNKYPNYKIFIIDVLTYAGNIENLKDVEAIDAKEGNGRLLFFKNDIGDKDFLESLFTTYKFDRVFNFAAESHVDRSFFNFSSFIRTNIEGAFMIAMMVYKFGGAMTHISTDEIYGSIENGSFKEEDVFAPRNPYASSKAAAEILLKTFREIYGVPIQIVRGTNNYGPYQYPEKLIPIAITNIIENKKIPLHGRGEHIRQWIHVEDFCRGIDLVVEKGDKNGIYNIGGEYYNNLNVLRKIGATLGEKIENFIKFVPDRPNPDMRYAVDLSKIEKLGWKRKYNFEEELPKVVEWYIKNEDWWRKIKNKKEYMSNYRKQAKSEYL